MHYHYIICGKKVLCEFPLGNLPQVKKSRPEITIKMAVPTPGSKFKWYHSNYNSPGVKKVSSFGINEDGHVVRIHGLADFKISKRGKKISCISSKKLSSEDLQ